MTMKLMATEAEAKSMKMKLMATEAEAKSMTMRLKRVAVQLYRQREPAEAVSGAVQLYTASNRDNVQVL